MKYSTEASLLNSVEFYTDSKCNEPTENVSNFSNHSWMSMIFLHTAQLYYREIDLCLNYTSKIENLEVLEILEIAFHTTRIY